GGDSRLVAPVRPEAERLHETLEGQRARVRPCGRPGGTGRTGAARSSGHDRAPPGPGDRVVEGPRQGGHTLRGHPTDSVGVARRPARPAMDSPASGASKPPERRTRHLILRAPDPSDVDPLFAIQRDPVAMRFTYCSPSRAATAARLDAYAARFQADGFA